MIHYIDLDLLQGALKEVQKILPEPPKTYFRCRTGDEECGNRLLTWIGDGFIFQFFEKQFSSRRKRYV